MQLKEMIIPMLRILLIKIKLINMLIMLIVMDGQHFIGHVISVMNK